MFNEINELSKLNKDIIESHNKNFKDGFCVLINYNEAPNTNLIYHLYNDGEITYQKGSVAYKRRSEFTYKYRLLNSNSYNNILDLPIKLKDNISYAVLTKEECEYYYDKLNILIEKLNL